MFLERTRIRLRSFCKVAARQNERRLEESKAEAGQLRNRLTLVEKNLNDSDPEAKIHRKCPYYKILIISRESNNEVIKYTFKLESEFIVVTLTYFFHI